MAERVSAKLKRKKKDGEIKQCKNKREKKNSERSEKLHTIIKRNKVCLQQEK